MHIIYSAVCVALRQAIDGMMCVCVFFIRGTMRFAYEISFVRISTIDGIRIISIFVFALPAMSGLKIMDHDICGRRVGKNVVSTFFLFLLIYIIDICMRVLQRFHIVFLISTSVSALMLRSMKLKTRITIIFTYLCLGITLIHYGTFTLIPRPRIDQTHSQNYPYHRRNIPIIIFQMYEY